MPPLDSLTWIQGSPIDVMGNNNKKDKKNNHSSNDVDTTTTTFTMKLCLLVQPNCPGCHQFALPVLNELYKELEKQKSQQPQQQVDVDIYVVSTAFEDFEYNTIESAQKMVYDQELIGISRQVLGPSSDRYYNDLSMPVAHDMVVSKEIAPVELIQLALQATKEQVKQELNQTMQSQESQQEQEQQQSSLDMILQRLDVHVLPEKLAHVFYAVHARGTPTWILHDCNGQVLDQQLGSLSKEQLCLWIDTVRQQQQQPH